VFTGLISELGTVNRLQGSTTGYKLEICAQKSLQDIKVGDSIAINGACLTVVEFSSESFTVDVMPETIKKTVLGKLHIGEYVNLERTLKVGDNLDGHFVTGHVEGIGRIVYRHEEGNATVFSITCSDDLLKRIVPKGSIAVDGISLTVVEVEQHGFSVSIIPHTMKATTLGFKRESSLVNLETDILGRYIEKYMGKDDKFWQNLNTL